MKKFVVAGIIALSTLFTNSGISEAHVFENIMACGDSLEEAKIKALDDATDMYGEDYNWAKIIEYKSITDTGRVVIIVNVEVN
jgi:hypothetical protein